MSDREERGWEFLFLGADQDGISAAAELSIDAGSSIRYASTGVGVRGAFTSVSQIVSLRRSGGKKRGSGSGGGVG